MSSEPACKIWWHLCIIGTLALISILGLYGLHWTNYCRANEIAIDVAESVAERRATDQEILRRLDRIERKIDGDTK